MTKTDEQRQEKRAAIQAMARRISEMSDEQRAAALGGVVVLTVEGRAVSVHNMLMLAYQRSGVTVVGGYRQWQAIGRQVRKGETGLSIWVPRFAKSEDGGEAKTGYLLLPVFDVTQTDLIEADQPQAA